MAFPLVILAIMWLFVGMFSIGNLMQNGALFPLPTSVYYTFGAITAMILLGVVAIAKQQWRAEHGAHLHASRDPRYAQVTAALCLAVAHKMMGEHPLLNDGQSSLIARQGFINHPNHPSYIRVPEFDVLAKEVALVHINNPYERDAFLRGLHAMHPQRLPVLTAHALLAAKSAAHKPL